MTQEKFGTTLEWRDDYEVFRYVSCEVEDYRAVSTYELAGPSSTVRFTETVEFPAPAKAPDAHTAAVFRRVIQLMHLASGVSYYKAGAPPRIEVNSVPLPPSVAEYLRELYQHGLGEFAFRNQLPHALRPEFVISDPTEPEPLAYQPGERPVVGMGGGKDSIVSMELLTRAGKQPVLFAVNANQVMRDVAEVADIKLLVAKRRLDQQLFDLNDLGAHNGHVPVTAINSLIAVAASVLHGLGPVVMSNERSASSPNLRWEGQEINHQWSKSLVAERRLAETLTAYVGDELGYFSLLRPLSELHIARIFAENTTYDDVFTSCNVAFKLRRATTSWCGNCPKCRFVFLAFAPFMTRERLTGIFNKNLLDDALQLPGYRELTGLDGQKPFECVGEIEESLVALRLISEGTEWSESPVVKQLVAELPPGALPTPEIEKQTFTPSSDHHVPADYATVLP